MRRLTADGDTFTMMDCVDCYAVPGAGSIIDVIDPRTDLTWCYQKTADDIARQEPGAVRMTIDAWTQQQAARQRTPWAWEPSTAKQYQNMLEVLPPAYWHGGIFAVGEPDDHDAGTGQPRFRCYRQQGDTYAVASRPLTIAELKAGPTA